MKSSKRCSTPAGTNNTSPGPKEWRSGPLINVPLPVTTTYTCRGYAASAGRCRGRVDLDLHAPVLEHPANRSPLLQVTAPSLRRPSRRASKVPPSHWSPLLDSVDTSPEVFSDLWPLVVDDAVVGGVATFAAAHQHVLAEDALEPGGGAAAARERSLVESVLNSTRRHSRAKACSSSAAGLDVVARLPGWCERCPPFQSRCWDEGQDNGCCLQASLGYVQGGESGLRPCQKKQPGHPRARRENSRGTH